MSSRHVLARFAFCLGLLAGLSACAAVPMGMYGHYPELVWTLEPEAVDLEIPQPLEPQRVVVLKRFENQSLVPVGAHFIGDQPRTKAMSQGYAPANDLTVAIFDNAARKLAKAHYNVWRDYQPAASCIVGPPDVTDFIILHGTVEELEVDTFQVPSIQEAARIRIVFREYLPDGQMSGTFEVATQVKIQRGTGDVLEALGQRVAYALAEALNGGFRS